jgi:glycosyltransferase involved in cell wall biosynthesis
MRALLMCQNLGVGGAEELLAGCAHQLPYEDIEVEVVAITRRGKLGDEIAQRGTPVHLLPGQPGPRDPAAFVRLVRLLRARRADIAHAFLLNACLYGRLAAIIARTPGIFVAEQNVYEQKARRHALMERVLSRGTNRVIACCQTVADFYRRQVGVGNSKLAVVYNAVRFGPHPTRAQRDEARRSLGFRDDHVVIGTLGRLTEQKDHLTLIQASARLAPNARVIIAGDGPMRPMLEREIDRLDVADRVRLLGIRRDRDTLYAAMDIFALPSRWEGLSLALVEAMGAGLPVVATAVGGTPEVVRNAHTGVLVEPRDVDVLAHALGQLAADPERRQSLGQAAADEALERFAIERHAREIAHLYRAAVTANRRSE